MQLLAILLVLTAALWVLGFALGLASKALLVIAIVWFVLLVIYSIALQNPD